MTHELSWTTLSMALAVASCARVDNHARGLTGEAGGSSAGTSGNAAAGQGEISDGTPTAGSGAGASGGRDDVIASGGDEAEGGAGSAQGGGANAGSGGAPSPICLTPVPSFGRAGGSASGEQGDCGSSPPPTDPSDSTAVQDPNVLWCTSPDDIWATDVKYGLIHWDGQSWHPMSDDPCRGCFQSAWGSHSQGVWFVGTSGGTGWLHGLVVFHWDGTQLKWLRTYDSSDPISQIPMAWTPQVFGTSDGVWILGEGAWKVVTPLPTSCLVDFQ